MRKWSLVSNVVKSPHILLLLPKGIQHHFCPVTWFFRCIGEGLFWSCIPPIERLWWWCSHLTSPVQHSNYPTSGVVWSTNTSSTTCSLQECPGATNVFHSRMDWFNNSSFLDPGQFTQVQGACWQSYFTNFGCNLIRSMDRSHVINEDNPADCSSRGMFSSELLSHGLWWSGPHWLKLPASQWPKINKPDPVTSQKKLVNYDPIACSISIIQDPLLTFHRFSSFNQQKRIIAWVIWFLNNCRAKTQGLKLESGPLVV